ncbi:serine/threonine-protein kinase [Polyangium sp. 6x1]|uniref:protein kinase domain-containing protein n=1 Tax=Polyangium sp. 6x1 TaxID=3042689 RepID=UPI002482E45D|nr:serine/threonine-protein kinase [Polyangium sp. 6x1]MDI1449307.1 serine/threonine-protein kinase [Polyangium sp. 6x1]
MSTERGRDLAPTEPGPPASGGVVQVDLGVASTLPLLAPGPPSKRRRVPRSLAERYEDIRFLGEGGMGTVYRAMDPHLGRIVALKLLKGDDPELWRRFLGEARAQARIQHEHVCRVYEAGQADGEPYIAMQYIDGEPLSKIAEKLTLEQSVKLMREVSAAVHEAHRLGVIHRDIKPGNILVEAREDGSLKPYVMDFGLAREVEGRGQTQTGAVLGTPAYMPPEQAKGDVRSMDRRSDVYSLGATLYDVIAGRPPFVEEHAWNLLMAVAYEDAPSLGTVKKGLPAELETIVMKCLEREPSRRYDSARALAEDLQRFLDGEPILARRASIGYVLLKKARKHKLATSLLALVLGASLVLVGVWVRAQRQAAEQARLARELGEGVKEMELFLRAAYELPLHDVERERDVVRARLGEIEARMVAAGRAGEGPGHYAIGRGHLALGDPDAAREHLEKALAAGYSSADLEYALGRALGELFRRALAETRRITNEEERKKKVEELDRALRDPALGHLRAALAAKIEVPAYAEGLIALYEGKHEEAIQKAKEAFGKAPWMYEAKKLEADALFAEGSKYRHDAAFDHEKMKSFFEPGAAAYEIAADMGRSDPEVHRAECELWEKMAQAALSKGLPSGPPFDRAEAVCSRAVQSSSKDGLSRVQQALVLTARVYARLAMDDASEDTVRAAEDALGAAEESARTNAEDVMAHYAVALANRMRTEALFAVGKPASMAKAIEAYERVLVLDPRFTWAVNELGMAYVSEAGNEISAGRDGSTLLRSAIRQFDQAMAIDPRFVLPVGQRLPAFRMLLESEIEQGRPTDETLAALFDAVALLEKTGASPSVVAYWKARAERLRGLRDFVLGRDPRAALGEAAATIRSFAGPAPKEYWLLEEIAECRLLEASYALREGLDATPLLAEAREAIQISGGTSGGKRAEFRLLSTRIEIVALRVAAKHGKLESKSFEVAFEQVRPLLAKAGRDSRPYVLGAEIHALRSEWLSERGGEPEEDIKKGLAMAEEALSKNPHLAKALLVKGMLSLVEARRARGKSERTEAARRAKEACRAAFQSNPSLERDDGRLLKEAETLAP